MIRQFAIKTTFASSYCSNHGCATPHIINLFTGNGQCAGWSTSDFIRSRLTDGTTSAKSVLIVVCHKENIMILIMRLVCRVSSAMLLNNLVDDL